MRYLSLCSGIEAATVAWSPLGWQPVAFSEIDDSCNLVLAHHYPKVPNWGDMEKFYGWRRPTIDVLVGGTPCQAFSIAGLRGGLADPRGNLTLGFLAVLERFCPRWFLWENVPGAFSATDHVAPDPRFPHLRMEAGRVYEETDTYTADERHAFGCFLAGLQELGYGFAYRTLDAQYFGVPQRRRRVFVVGHSSGNWHGPAAVLFERESLRRNSPPRRETRSRTTGTLAARAGGGGRPDGGDGRRDQLVADQTEYAADVAYALETTCHDYSRADGFNMIADAENLRVFESRYARNGLGAPDDVCPPLKAESNRGDGAPLVYQCHGDNVGSMGTLRSGHNEISGVPFTFDETQITSPENRSDPKPGDPANTIPANGRPPTVAYSIMPEAGQGADITAKETKVGQPLGVSRNDRKTHIVESQASRVRRLTPLECERLMGFPDNYTNVPGVSDSARYRMLGNSIVVDVLHWIGGRLATVDAILQAEE